MATDKSDKTVFRQSRPVQGGKRDETIIRPSPGRRGTQTSVAPASAYQPARHEATRSAASDNPYLNPSFKTSFGLNPLVNAASTLIAVFYNTRKAISHPNVAALHQQMVAELRQLEARLQKLQISPEISLSARYILCTALDEAVLNTPWGAESAWTQRSLLSLFHNETNGGEKFFLILDRMKAYPQDNLDMLELLYLLLSLGYEGKYRVISRGRDALERIREDLYATIRSYRGEYERELSPSWHGLGNSRNTLSQYMPMWVMASITAGVLVLSYSGFRYWLHHTTEEVASQLTAIAAPAQKHALSVDRGSGVK